MTSKLPATLNWCEITYALETQIYVESAKDLTPPWSEEYREGYVDGLKRAIEVLGELAPQNQSYFNITSVHRDDLEAEGFDASQIDDDTMRKLASKLADAYCEHMFWIDLPIIAKALNIAKLPDAD